MAASDLTNLADRHQERADRLAECSRQTALTETGATVLSELAYPNGDLCAELRAARKDLQ